MTATPLMLRANGEDHFAVECNGRTVGQIIARKRSFGRKVWFWSLSGPHLPPGMPISGSNAMTLEGAKSAIATALAAWQHRPVTWARR